MNSLFEYIDYRIYLDDYFKTGRKKIRFLNEENFVRNVGISGTKKLKEIMRGKRLITREMCEKISDILKHSDAEREYFLYIVLFHQAEDHKSKDKYLRDILKLRYNIDFGKIEKWQYDYYSHWYNPVIPEIVCSRFFDGDYKKAADILNPPVSAKEVKDSVKLLEKLDMIEKISHGYKQKNGYISTGDTVSSVSVVNFMKKMAVLACEAFDRYSKSERSISSCTLFIPSEKISVIRDEVSAFRKKIMALTEKKEKADRVYQINFQVFPLTERMQGGSKQS